MGNPEETHLLERPLESFPITPPLRFLIFYFFIIFFTELLKKTKKSYTLLIYMNQSYFFPLSSLPSSAAFPPKSLSFSLSLSIVLIPRVSASSRRARLHCVLLFLLIARYFHSLEGEIISNYRENRRCRNLPCTSPGIPAGVRTRPAVANRLFGGFRAYLA